MSDPYVHVAGHVHVPQHILDEAAAQLHPLMARVVDRMLGSPATAEEVEANRVTADHRAAEIARKAISITGDTLESIVRTLADDGPARDYESGDCTLCGEYDVHEPTCAYRRAVEWVEAQAPSTHECHWITVGPVSGETFFEMCRYCGGRR